MFISHLLRGLVHIQSHLVPLVYCVHQELHQLCPLHCPISVYIDFFKQLAQSENQIVELCSVVFYWLESETLSSFRELFG